MYGRTVDAARMLAIALFAVLLGACGNVAGPLPRGPADMEGEITRLTADAPGGPGIIEILIEEELNVPLEEWLRNPGPGYEKVLWSVGQNTAIFRERGDGSRDRAATEDLVAGASVRAWNLGYFVETGLPRAGARMHSGRRVGRAGAASSVAGV
jgi:hypothetical protein